MNKYNTERSLQERIDDLLRRIANFLLLNASFIDNPGVVEYLVRNNFVDADTDGNQLIV